ncbi:MAG: nitroreductase family protein [SAR324 cluster bacterium]|nr:nitroreductase family protein [SAR324 cluster bacterium]
MTILDLSATELLTTTRAVRKRLDLTRPVELELIQECLQLALQAPTGGNAQRWHFVVVTDADKRAALAELYRRSFAVYRDSAGSAGALYADDPQRAPQQKRVMDSAAHLADHMHEVPVHVIPCSEGRAPMAQGASSASMWASVYPAAWSFMLAARLRGLGTCLTTLHLVHEQEAAELLGIPYDRISQGGLIPTAHTLGTDFKAARRQPLADVLHVNGWSG